MEAMPRIAILRAAWPKGLADRDWDECISVGRKTGFSMRTSWHGVRVREFGVRNGKLRITGVVT
jgi:hypothetical protein